MTKRTAREPDWRCCGCGMPGLLENCDCVTNVAFDYHDGKMVHAFKIDVPEIGCHVEECADGETVVKEPTK